MKTIQDVATSLLKTLEKTETEIKKLHAGLSSQLEALRSRKSIALQESTDEVNDISQKLRLLLEAKMQQAQMLASALEIEDARTDLQSIIDSLTSDSEISGEIDAVRARIRNQVDRTNRLYEDLAFALHYSATLDEELLMAVVDHSSGDESITYSPTGKPGRSPGGGRLLNRIA